MASTTCGWCGRLANLKLIDEGVCILSQRGGGHEVLAAFRCDGCSRLLLAHVDDPFGSVAYHTVERYFDEVSDQVRWLPATGDSPTFPDVPAHIAESASEAYRCFSIGAHRGAVAIARAVVEATAKDQGITVNGIASKIDKMHEMGLISANMKDAAHEVRHLGNEMAHGDFVAPVPADDTILALTFMSEVLQFIYQSPARVSRARAARQQRRATTPNPPANAVPTV